MSGNSYGMTTGKRIGNGVKSFILNLLMLVFSLSCIFPLVWMLYSSLKVKREFNRDIIGLPSNPTLENFVKVLTNPDYHIGDSIMNSVRTTLISVFFIVLFGIMNYRGAKSVGNLQLAMVLIMCAAVAVSVAGTVLTGSFDAANLAPAYGAGGKSFGGGFVSILALAPFLYVGFDCIPQAAEEYDFPPQKCKKLIISALIVGALIYGAMALVTDSVLPWQQVLTMKDASGAPVKWHTGAVLDLAMGRLGVGFVAIAVCMGIFTGMNGFFMTSSRLLFGMARAKMLPSAFGKIHPKHKTPSFCVVFVTIICCICPFFGREVIGWVVDMCSVGTAFGYFFTCAGAYILLKKYGDPTDTNRIHPAVAMGGCFISVAILLLLIIPGSPAFMAPQSFIALVVWILLGVLFYYISRKNFMKITKREMDYLILGNVQVVRGMRKGQEPGQVVQGNVVNPKQ